MECGLKILLQRSVVQSTFVPLTGRVYQIYTPMCQLSQKLYEIMCQTCDLTIKPLVIRLKSLRNADSHPDADWLSGGLFTSVPETAEHTCMRVYDYENVY